MTSEEIFELARKRTPPPESMSLSERMLFTIARNLYKAYKDGIITSEQAQTEKRDAIYRFNLDKSKEEAASQQRAQMFRLTDEMTSAMEQDKMVRHTYGGFTNTYKIYGVITRYDKDKGWTYSLELQDPHSRCLVIASPEDTEVI